MKWIMGRSRFPSSTSLPRGDIVDQVRNNLLQQGETKSVRVDLQGSNASGASLVFPLFPLRSSASPRFEVELELLNDALKSPSFQ